MIRRFLSGMFWGGAVAALGLGTVSQLTPLPVARIAADASAVQRAKPAPVETEAAAEKPIVAPTEVEVVVPEVTPTVEPAVEPAVKPVVEPAVEPEVERIVAPTAPAASGADQLDPPAGSEFAEPLPDVDPVVPAAEAVAPAEPSEALPLTPPASDVATVTDAPAAAPETGLASPQPLDLPAEAETAVVAPAAVEADEIALADPVQPAAPQTDAAPAVTVDPPPAVEPEPADALLKPAPEILPEPVPEAEPAPSLQLEPDEALLPEASPATEPTGEDAGTLAPNPGLAGQVDGVTIGRLPRIGDAAVPADEAAGAAEVPQTDAATLQDDAEFKIDGEADLPPLQKYARAFDNADAKPLFAIILIDTGGAELDRAALAALPFPVTFALDPLAPNVAEASKVYRDAGQEVIMVATGIPNGATASDLEVTFQTHATVLPEAVAVIDTEFGSFQADRPLATQVVPILMAQGRGLISWDRGLNAADQVARREGLAATMVFRKLDGKGENSAAVRRALDRAAFKAAQDGRVTVIGQTIPATVAALMEWAVEGRAASVALAPVSAVLTTQ